MAKTFDFIITIRRADFKNNMVIVPFGGDVDIYKQKIVNSTLADALNIRQKMSDNEARPHAAFIAMQNKDDRKPAGFGKVQTLYKE